MNPLLAPLEERILIALLLLPDRERYRSELARELGVRPSSLQRPLRRLSKAGILTTRQSGNRIYFRANTQSPEFQDLSRYLAKTSGLIWVIREALEKWRARISVAFVYGSIAAGEQLASSDVDLLVIGQAGLSELAVPLREASVRLGREVNPMVYTAEEVGKRVHAEDRFMMSILDKPKLFVIGTEDDLRGIVGSR